MKEYKCIAEKPGLTCQKYFLDKDGNCTALYHVSNLEKVSKECLKKFDLK